MEWTLCKFMDLWTWNFHKLFSMEDIFFWYLSISRTATVWKVSKYRVFCGPNTGKYGPEKIPYLKTFHAVSHFSGYPWKAASKNKVYSAQEQLLIKFPKMISFQDFSTFCPLPENNCTATLSKKGFKNFGKSNFQSILSMLFLREKCPNTELFLVNIFLYSDWIRRFTE